MSIFKIVRYFSQNVVKGPILPVKAEIPTKQEFENVKEIVEHPTKAVVIEKDDKFKNKVIKVCIIGADERSGQITALHLKQHPLIQKIYLHGEDCSQMAMDLNNIDTSCIAEGFTGTDQIAPALRPADIVVIMDTHFKDSNIEKKFCNVAWRVNHLATHCAKHCPRAVVIVCAEPVCCTLPLVEAVYKETPWFHPSRIIGCVSPLQARMNTIAGRYLDLDPSYVHVPLVGGPDYMTAVPLISLISPNPGLCPDKIQRLNKLLLNESHLYEKETCTKTMLSEGYAIAQFIITVAKGLCGHTDAIAPVVVRTNIIEKLKYIVTNVKFGDGGVVTNFGLPKMTRYELEQLESSILILQKRQKLVSRFVGELQKENEDNEDEEEEST